MFSVSGEMFEVTGADWTSTGRLFNRRGPAAANDRPPTVTLTALKQFIVEPPDPHERLTMSQVISLQLPE